MKEAIIHYLACPECLSESLQLEKTESGNAPGVNGIVGGTFLCNECGRHYPIIDGIPYLVTDGLRRELLEEVAGKSESGNGELAEQVTLANIRFHNKVADVYETDLSTKGVFTTFSQNRVQDALKFIVANTSGELLLDMGCGTANVLRSANRLFQSAIGTDISVSMIRKPVQMGLNAVIGSCTQSPYKSGCADAVSAFSVLHHLLDPTLLFKEAYRLLKDGGWLYTDWDPNAENVEKLRGSLLANGLQKVYGKGLGWFFKYQKGGTAFHTSSDDEDALSRLAEYHHHYSNGFHKKEMQSVLRHIGFREIRIIRHWNSMSFEGEGLQEVPLGQRFIMWAKVGVTFCFDPEALAPNMMILAKK